MTILKIEDFKYLDKSAQRMVANLIRENNLALEAMNMPKARAIYQHILSVCRNAGGERHPLKVSSPNAPGFYGSATTVTVSGGSVTGVTITNPGRGYPYYDPPSEILESASPKLTDQLNTRDWWELGKDIVKD